MFYLLPFNDKARMDALHKQRLISANMATFLSNVNADLSRHDTMDQLRTGWLKYLKYDSTRASAGLVVPSSVESRFRRSLPISENADGGQNSPEAASAAGGGPGRAIRDRTPVTPSQDHAGQGADNSGSNSDRSFHPPTPHPILPIAFNHSVSVSHLNHPPPENPRWRVPAHSDSLSACAAPNDPGRDRHKSRRRRTYWRQGQVSKTSTPLSPLLFFSLSQPLSLLSLPFSLFYVLSLSPLPLSPLPLSSSSPPLSFPLFSFPPSLSLFPLSPFPSPLSSPPFSLPLFLPSDS